MITAITRRIPWCLVSITLATTAVRASVAAAAPCPTTCYEASTPSVCTTASHADTSYCFGSGSGSGCGHAQFDLVQGTSMVSGDWRGEGAVNAADRYTLVGPSAGTPVPIVVHLRVTGYVGRYCIGGVLCASGSVNATLSDSAGASVIMNTGNFTLSSLDLPLTKLAGTPFVLGWRTQAYGSVIDRSGVGASESATLSFDLPPGVGVVSCSGYAAGFVTPTEHASWGALKTRYH